MTKNKLLLVDGNSVAFRAFFALHNSLERFKNRNGLHTNAIYAFNTMFENVMQKSNRRMFWLRSMQEKRPFGQKCMRSTKAEDLKHQANSKNKCLYP